MTDVTQQLFVTSDPVISGLIWDQLTPNSTANTHHEGNPLLMEVQLPEPGDSSD